MRLPRTYKEWVSDLRYGFGLRAIDNEVEMVIRDPTTTLYAVEQIKEHAKYWLKLIEIREERNRKMTRIASMRNTAGRTPEEIKAFLAKADELEAELD